MVEQEFKIGDEVEYNSDYDSLVHEGIIAFHTTPGNVCVDFGPKCRFGHDADGRKGRSYGGFYYVKIKNLRLINKEIYKLRDMCIKK